MVNFKEDEQLKTLNHSCAHLMAQAIKHLYPQAKFWVGEDRPFPLPELFCLARIRTMDGRRWAEYRFLGRDPVPPEEK